MSITLYNDFENIIHTYIQAKDKNQPSLMKQVFSRDAVLEIKNKSAHIELPAITTGLSAITDTLVTNFNQSYENVYTYCLLNSFQNGQSDLSCQWLVIMREKASKKLRVGCGRYDWIINDHFYTLANKLIITIEHMIVLPTTESTTITKWQGNLDYPFTEPSRLLEKMSELEALRNISQPTACSIGA
ncbi:hypothetical protein [Spartinivicinus ruber]|uniref:hypothetical protein n=1 Tax=Spartinivicinus ruber TaxID=2683272 RepID=UPI0013D79D9E|nr:hypothetical protein [Spartinivicinus ruber]